MTEDIEAHHVVCTVCHTSDLESRHPHGALHLAKLYQLLTFAFELYFLLYGHLHCQCLLRQGQFVAALSYCHNYLCSLLKGSLVHPKGQQAADAHQQPCLP